MANEFENMSREEITKFDRECLQKAIEVATETFNQGINYPVGAVLAINDKIIDVSGNQINQHKSLTNHAENNLIRKNGKQIYRVIKSGKPYSIALYSTLEPCIQCLGACITNHIGRVVYIQKDPHGGACNIKNYDLGLRYQEFWPEIIHAPISKKPKRLIINFFKKELKRERNIEWATKMLKLLKNC